MMAVDVRKCRYFGGYLVLAEEILGEFSWFEEMAPEGERKLVADTCQDRDEVRFEGLYGSLCLIVSVIVGGDQFELYLLPADVLLERIRRFVVQRVLFYSQSCHSHPPVDYFLIRPYHFLLRPIAHWFNEDVICIEVDGHHYVPVASLECERECSGLIGVDGVGEVVNAEESLMGFGDGGDLVGR